METVRRVVVGRPALDETGGAGEGVLWLVPDGRVARSVRRRLLERFGCLGAVQVWTLDETAARVLTQAGEGGGFVPSVVQSRLVAGILASSRENWGGRPAGELADWPGVRRGLARQLRAFREEGVSPEDLRSAAEELPPGDALWARRFARLLEDYELKLGAAGRATDEAGRLARACGILERHSFSGLFPGVRRVAAWGFLRLPALAARLLAAVRGVEAVEVFAPRQVAERTDLWAALGWRHLERAGFGRVAGESPDPVAVCVSRGYADDREQWEGIARRIRAWVEEGLDPERIAVVTDRPLTPESTPVRIFAEHGVALGEPVVRPLARVPVVQYILGWLEILVRDWPREWVMYAASGFHEPQGEDRRPLLARWARIPPGRRGVAAWIEALAAARERIGEDPGREGERKALEGAVRWLEEKRAIFADRPHRATLAEWAEVVEDWCRKLGVDRRLRERARAASGEEEWAAVRLDLEGYSRFVRVLRTWRETDAWVEWPGACSLSQMADWLRDELETQWVVEWPAQEGGVRVVSPETAWAGEFDALVFPGLQEGEFPRPERDGWLLPDAVAEALARAGRTLRTRRDRAAEQELQLSLALVYTRKEVELTYAGGEGSLPSRCLEVLWRTGACREAGPFASAPAEGPPFSSLAAWRQWEREAAVEKEAEEDLSPALRSRLRRIAGKTAVEKLREGRTFSPWEGQLADASLRRRLGSLFSEDRVYSASLFNEYGICPFRFFAKRLLRLDAVRESDEALDPAAAGSLYHKILAALFRRAADSGDPGIWTDRERALEMLRDLWEEEIARLEREEGVAAFVTWPFQRDRLWSRLSRWVEYDWESRRQSGAEIKPAYVEWAFGAAGGEADARSSPSPVVVAGLLFRGRVDRIDAAPDGRFILYDYKRTTGGDRHGRGAIAKGVDVQLPIYLEAVRQVLFPQGRPLGAAYYGLEPPDRRREGLWRKGEDHGLGARTGLGEDEWTELMEGAKRTVREYHQRMRDGYFPVAPRACLENSCEFVRICRKDEANLLRKGVAAKGGEDDADAD
ncbi:MAG: PD-(D/E)XK nuclease family protein [Alicyclobacillaceae bacterium]|nr:PD-(D/E)XK nuclease family protein [Alicyclobacillaceae bacterium]